MSTSLPRVHSLRPASASASAQLHLPKTLKTTLGPKSALERKQYNSTSKCATTYQHTSREELPTCPPGVPTSAAHPAPRVKAHPTSTRKPWRQQPKGTVWIVPKNVHRGKHVTPPFTALSSPHAYAHNNQPLTLTRSARETRGRRVEDPARGSHSPPGLLYRPSRPQGVEHIAHRKPATRKGAPSSRPSRARQAQHSSTATADTAV